MSDYFIGRQPIFDANMDLHAYELLFRDGNTSRADFTDGETATSQVMTTTIAEIGLDNLVGEHRAFINLTRFFVTHPDLILFPPEQVVLEILEDIDVDQEVLAGVKALREKGYTIALDDFSPSPKMEPLVDLADIIKIDITAISHEALPKIVGVLKSRGKTVLAEKVETIEDFERLEPMAFDHFQGYFFAKPKVVSGKKLPSNKMALVELTAKVHNPDIEIHELQELVSRDVALSVKAMRFANAPINGLRRSIDSVQQAIVYLGVSTLKNWVTVLAMSEMDDKPTELVTLALARGRMCELLAKKAGLENEGTFFTVGMFSVLDALLDSDMEVVVESLPLQAESREALVNHTGLQGEALTLAMDMEMGVASESDFYGVEVDKINELYLTALQWADGSMSSIH